MDAIQAEERHRERRDAILRLMNASVAILVGRSNEGSARARSASQSSLASASGHSQDQGPDGVTEVVCEEEVIQAPLEETAVRGAARHIYLPFLLRDDVGILGVLSGNWGGKWGAERGHCSGRWTSICGPPLPHS